MIKSALQILSFGILLIVTGCVTLYKPNVIHSPMLKTKGEVSTSASLGLSGCGLYNLQAAYGISNHIGVMVDGMYHNRYISDDSSVEKLNMFFGEAGVGYFTTFTDTKNLLFQCYSGIGYGSTTDKIHNSGQPTPEVNANYINMFFQPGMSFTAKYIDVAFDIRANYVHLFNINAYLYDKFEFWNTDFKYNSGATIDFMNLEPTITAKIGGGKWKGVMQLGVTIPTVNAESYFSVNTSSLLVVPLIKYSVGINYNFGRK